MIYIKLQIGCLLVILYIVVTYVKATLGEKLVRNRYFDALMVTAPWAVIFDGVTSWTVNHQDVALLFGTTWRICCFLFLWISRSL